MKINNFPLKLFVWAHFLRYLLLCKGNAGDKLLLGRSVPFFFLATCSQRATLTYKILKSEKSEKKKANCECEYKIQNTRREENQFQSKFTCVVLRRRRLGSYSLECAFHVVAGFQFSVFGARSGKHIKNWLKPASGGQHFPKAPRMRKKPQLIDK